MLSPGAPRTRLLQPPRHTQSLRPWLVLQVLLLFFLVLPSLNQVHGQEPIPRAEPAISGSVVIVVSDFSGAVVPNANVTVTNRSTGITLTAQTDTKGRVKIPSLPRATMK